MVSYEVNGVTFNMLRVASHLEKVSSELCFKMGATETEKGYYGNELPKHIERFQEFFIAETPVTEALWHAVMGDNYSLKDEDKEKPQGPTLRFLADLSHQIHNSSNYQQSLFLILFYSFISPFLFYH